MAISSIQYSPVMNIAMENHPFKTKRYSIELNMSWHVMNKNYPWTIVVYVYNGHWTLTHTYIYIYYNIVIYIYTYTNRHNIDGNTGIPSDNLPVSHETSPFLEVKHQTSWDAASIIGKSWSRFPIEMSSDFGEISPCLLVTWVSLEMGVYGIPLF